jgi:hypothetical protein
LAAIGKSVPEGLQFVLSVIGESLLLFAAVCSLQDNLTLCAS